MNSRSLLVAVKEVLDQGESLLDSLDDLAYAQKIPQAFNASLGGHYRHCLDHFSSVFDGLGTMEVNYDARKRDFRIESVREAALATTRRLRHRAEALSESQLDQFIWARSKVSYAGGESPRVASTVGRELMFCIVHAIHHYALMGVMCGLLDIPLREGFGIAPSTIQHHKQAARLAA